MTDMWLEASAGHEAVAHEAAMARAEAGFEEYFPFLAGAQTEAEFRHRMALAQDQIEGIGANYGLDPGIMTALARRRWELLRQALQEGQDPLEEVVQVSSGSGQGSGPEKPVEHSTGPDFSGDYAEIPQGAPRGPNPGVTQVRPPMTGPVQEATGSLRRQADANPGSMMMPSSPSASPAAPSAMPSPAAGAGPNLPAGVSGNGATPPTRPDLTPAPDVASTTGLQNFASGLDPVRRRVMAVTAAIRETNTHLPDAECERVARQVVGRYLRQADLTDSVMDNKPDGGGSDGSQGGSGGMSGMGEALIGRQLIKAAPEMLAAL